MRSINMNKLAEAIEQARKIRSYLVAKRGRFFKNLDGDCGLASLLLAQRLGDVRTLRVYEHRYGGGHAWNEIGGVVVDITATQFIGGRGIYVGSRLDFHEKPTAKGSEAKVRLLRWDYSDEPAWARIQAWACE